MQQGSAARIETLTLCLCGMCLNQWATGACQIVPIYMLMLLLRQLCRVIEPLCKFVQLVRTLQFVTTTGLRELAAGREGDGALMMQC